MEAEKENLRCYIYTCMLCGQTARSIHEELQKVFGASVCSYNTVFRWMRKFKEGKTDFKDEPRSGAPVVACNEQTVNLVSQALEDDPHITVCDPADMSALSIGIVHKIVHEDLHTKKVCSKFVPNLMTPEQKAQ